MASPPAPNIVTLNQFQPTVQIEMSSPSQMKGGSSLDLITILLDCGRHNSHSLV